MGLVRVSWSVEKAIYLLEHRLSNDIQQSTKSFICCLPIREQFGLISSMLFMVDLTLNSFASELRAGQGETSKRNLSDRPRTSSLPLCNALSSLITQIPNRENPTTTTTTIHFGTLQSQPQMLFSNASKYFGSSPLFILISHTTERRSLAPLKNDILTFVTMAIMFGTTVGRRRRETSPSFDST